MLQRTQNPTNKYKRGYDLVLNPTGERGKAQPRGYYTEESQGSVESSVGLEAGRYCRNLVSSLRFIKWSSTSVLSTLILYNKEAHKPEIMSKQRCVRYKGGVSRGSSKHCIAICNKTARSQHLCNKTALYFPFTIEWGNIRYLYTEGLERLKEIPLSYCLAVVGLESLFAVSASLSGVSLSFFSAKWFYSLIIPGSQRMVSYSVVSCCLFFKFRVKSYCLWSVSLLYKRRCLIGI